MGREHFKNAIITRTQFRSPAQQYTNCTVLYGMEWVISVRCTVYDFPFNFISLSFPVIYTVENNHRTTGHTQGESPRRES